MSLTVHPGWSPSLSLLQLLSQHWPSHLLCLWILLRKTQVTPCVDYIGLFSWNLKWFEEKSALKWASSNASASHCISVLSRSVWSGACLLTSSSICWLASDKWLRVSTQHLWPERNCFSFSLCSIHLLTWLPSLMFAQCRCHTTYRTFMAGVKDNILHIGK